MGKWCKGKGWEIVQWLHGEWLRVEKAGGLKVGKGGRVKGGKWGTFEAVVVA